MAVHEDEKKKKKKKKNPSPFADGMFLSTFRTRRGGRGSHRGRRGPPPSGAASIASIWSRGSMPLTTQSMKFAPLCESAFCSLLALTRWPIGRQGQVKVRCSDRPHQGEDSDCFVGMIDAECGRRSVRRHFQTRPACFARSFVFDERLGMPHGQLVWRVLGISCGIGGSVAVGVAAFLFRPSVHWFYSNFHFGAREALGPLSVGRYPKERVH